MIDTIILTLPRGSYSILNHDRFTPSTKNLDLHTFGNQSYIKYVQNPRSSDLKIIGYQPRLTVTKRIVRGGTVTPLKIEFSCPKMLFGNNFDELREEDFEKVMNALQDRLKEMEVFVFKEVLKKAKISVIHFSKNIALTDYTTASLVVRELSKIDLTKRLDLNKTHFRNEGHALYYYSKSHSVIFYDKLKDLKMPNGRAIERDNAIQLDLFDYLKERRPLEILRMEVRLCDVRKIKSIFKILNIPDDLTFQAVFKQEISKKTLNYYWQEILGNLELLRFATSQPVDLLEGIIKNNDTLNLRTALSYFGALTIINSEGSRRLRQIINERYSDKSYHRINKDLSKLKSPSDNKYKPITTISEALKEFKTLKISDFEKQ